MRSPRAAARDAPARAATKTQHKKNQEAKGAKAKCRQEPLSWFPWEGMGEAGKWFRTCWFESFHWAPGHRAVPNYLVPGAGVLRADGMAQGVRAR